jgi:cytochrome c oxidase subunit II
LKFITSPGVVRSVGTGRALLIRITRNAKTVYLAGATVVFAACEESSSSSDIPSILDPRGPAADRIEGIWWLMLWISVGVFAVVLVLMAMAVWRGRNTSMHTLDKNDVRWGTPFVIVAGIIVPAIILSGLFVYSLREMNALAAPGRDASFEIEVIAHDWWWEARYPNGAVTANEIHIPIGATVRVTLTTRDVIHSFWVPQLQVKADNIPGRTTSVWLEANEPGRYRGQCAEFCGLQHANMALFVFAEQPNEFNDWLAIQAAPADEPESSSEEAGNEVFMSSSCAGCHTIRGTSANGDLAPDLTHVGSRTTIAGGIVSATRSNLAGFITDPHRFKPGVTMPPTELSRSEVEAVVDYLESLE